MKLSVIIVNYNVRFFLEQCLQSVKRAIKGLEAEVMVVDNHSSDQSVAMVREKFPWVKLIASLENLGFSKANNLGIRESKGEHILLLNPDTVVAEDTFQKCIAFMESHPEAGALGVHMIDGRGEFLPESKRGLPTPEVSFYKMFGLAALFPQSKTFGKYHLGYLPEHEPHEVEILSGAFMFIRREALNRAGLLDEAFFMYGEDIDLSYRLIQAGYKNYYFADTTIIHYKGESTKKGTLNYVRVFYSAMLIFARKHYSSSRSGLMSLLIHLAVFFRGALTLLAGLLSSSYLFIVDGLVSFTGIYMIKNYWEKTVKYSPDYYPEQFLFIVVPVYVLIWIFSVFLSGGYDKPYRVLHVIRGVLAGTIAISAMYAFLPNEWRFSRAIILLGAAWTAGEMLLTRTVYHLIKHQSLFFESDTEKRTLLVGTEKECRRAENLLRNSGAGHEIIFAPSESANLPELTRLYGITEIIFCTDGYSFTDIIHHMQQCGKRLEYKILNNGSDVFIGSNSSDSPGKIYSEQNQFHLSQPAYRRKKRIVDVVVCIGILLLMPYVLLSKSRSLWLRNWWSVLSGKKTWVSYRPDLSGSLPPLAPGAMAIGEKQSNEGVAMQMNRLYARHYKAGDDFRLVISYLFGAANSPGG